MTKSKKCDYCKYRRTDTKRYKTSNKFLEGKKEHECGHAVQNVDQSIIVYLCDTCFDTIIPIEARAADNKIDAEWFTDDEMHKLFNKRLRGFNRIAFKMIPS